MKTKMLLLFTVAGLALASAKTYQFSVEKAAAIGTSELRAGAYKVKVEGSNVSVVDAGTNKPVAATATLANSDRKFPSTAILTKTVDGKDQIDAIELGGTKLRVEFR